MEILDRLILLLNLLHQQIVVGPKSGVGGGDALGLLSPGLLLCESQSSLGRLLHEMGTSASLLPEETGLLDDLLELRGDLDHEVVLRLVVLLPGRDRLGHPGRELIRHISVDPKYNVRANKYLHIGNPFAIQQLLVTVLGEVLLESIIPF